MFLWPRFGGLEAMEWINEKLRARYQDRFYAESIKMSRPILPILHRATGQTNLARTQATRMKWACSQQ